MKRLLIIGAGGHGKVTAEIAEATGDYEIIDFVDDNNANAVGKIADLVNLYKHYDSAFVGIGNNRFRFELIKKLQEIGYEIPTLIHPTVYLSKSATVEKGVVLEPKCIVNANTHIGLGCIISVGAIVDHDVKIGQSCHINAGAVVKAGAEIEDFRKLEAGEIVLGYGSAAGKPTVTTNSNSAFAKKHKEQTGEEISFF